MHGIYKKALVIMKIRVCLYFSAAKGNNKFINDDNKKAMLDFVVLFIAGLGIEKY